MLRFGAWKTPGDYAMEVRGDDIEARRLRNFLARFVEVAFGPEEPTAEALAGLLSQAEALGCPT